jgi:hypothetical protein
MMNMEQWFFMKMLFFLLETTKLTNNTAEFVIVLFNKNTCEAINIIVIYKPPRMQILFFLSILKNVNKYTFEFLYNYSRRF